MYGMTTGDFASSSFSGLWGSGARTAQEGETLMAWLTTWLTEAPAKRPGTCQIELNRNIYIYIGMASNLITMASMLSAMASILTYN